MGRDLGVPGAAQGPAHDRDDGAGTRLLRGDLPAGVGGIPTRQLRRGRPGHAPPGAGKRASGGAPPRAETRPRRTARRRIRRAASATRARTHRRHAARPQHPRRARRTRRRRLRRPRRRQSAHRGLRVPAPVGAPPAAATLQAHPPVAGGRRRAAQPLARPRRRFFCRQPRQRTRRDVPRAQTRPPHCLRPARAAVLPPAARRGGGHVRRRSHPVRRRREGPAGGVRVPPPGARVRPPIRAGQGNLPQGETAGDPAAVADALALRHRRSRPGAVELPQAFRSRGGPQLVFAHAARRRRGLAAPHAHPGHLAVRVGPDHLRARRGQAARRRLQRSAPARSRTRPGAQGDHRLRQAPPNRSRQSRRRGAFAAPRGAGPHRLR